MKFRALSILAVVGLASSAALAQTDIPWINSAGGVWSSAANWMGGMVPNDTGERGVISATGMYTVSIDTNFTINGLLIPNAMATVQLNDARTFVLGGTAPVLDHAGPFVVNATSGGNSTFLLFNATGTIQGTGPLILNASANLDTAYIQTGAALITNAAGHTIRGTGNIYAAMTNQGTITADVNGRTLQLLTGSKINQNLMSASAGGTLQINAITLNQNAAGVVRADAGGTVSLVNCGVSGGSLESQGSGVVRVNASSTLTGVLNFTGNLEVVDARSLTILGGLPNNGTITVNPTAGGNQTLITASNSGTLSGSGQIVLNATPNLDTAYINSGGVGTVLTNGPAHTIRGTGNIYAVLTNDGLISADVAGRTLQLLSNPKTNNATIQAINSGILQVSSATITQNAPGRFLADNATINLNSATIVGGDLEAVNSGLIQVTASSTLSGGVSLEGPLNINDARALFVSGGLTNNGLITVNPTAGANQTLFQFNTDSVLGGTGTIVLNATLNLDTAYLQTGGPGVINQSASHMVRGTGRIYGVFVNNGTVSADVTGRTLELLSSPKTNNALLEAVSGGILQIGSVALAQGMDGLLLADGGTLNLASCTVTGGSIRVQNAGLARVTASATVNNLASLEGPLHILDARSLVVNGSLPNFGTITVNPSAGVNGTLLQFNSSGTLTGTGDVLLNASLNLDTAYLQTSGAAVITNGPDHLIHGTGRIYAAFVNDGTVRADVTNRTLELLGVAKSNNALMHAVNGSTLQINTTTLTQAPTGLLVADGGFVNLNACTIVGGTVRGINGGVAQVTASSTLSNVLSVEGALNINDARVLTVAGGLSHDGIITVNPIAGVNGTFLQFSTSNDLAGPGTVLLNASANLDTAYLQTSGPALLTNAPGHTIAGRGHIYGGFFNSGIISPGNDAADRTSLIRRQGNYLSGPTSQVIIDLGGTAQGDTYDWLNATGSVALDGTLTVRLTPGYTPPANTVFTVVSGSVRSGQFSSVTLPTLPPSLGYARLEYTNNAVRVRIPLCSTDWNAMDGINSQDFFDFLNDFFGNNGDFNFDGFVNSQDFFDFLLSFFGGCE